VDCVGCRVYCVWSMAHLYVLQLIVHGAWCMVHGAWCMVHGAWCMVFSALFVVYSA
jgi:hypothetical protein